MLRAPAPARFTPPPHAVRGCELCENAGGILLWSDADWRIVRVHDAAFPAFYRLVSNAHVREFSDLAPAPRVRCMALVAAVEQAMRRELQPTKINLASLGNVVPHLHWHVIARFDWDSHFPQPIWGQAQARREKGDALNRLTLALGQMDDAVVRAASSMV